MNKVMLIVFGAAMLMLGAGCKETSEQEQPAAAQQPAAQPAEHPAEHPAEAVTPRDHPAH